jgi:hypothetical protein
MCDLTCTAECKCVTWHVLQNVNVWLSLVIMLIVHCNRLFRTLEVQKVERSIPATIAVKRRLDTTPSAGTKLPAVKRSRPTLPTGSDKQLQPTSMPQSSDNVGLSGNSEKLTYKVGWWKSANCLAGEALNQGRFLIIQITCHRAERKKFQVHTSSGSICVTVFFSHQISVFWGLWNCWLAACCLWRLLQKIAELSEKDASTLWLIRFLSQLLVRIWIIVDVGVLMIIHVCTWRLPGARGGTLVEALCYKPEGRWINSGWCHWNFSLT